MNAGDIMDSKYLEASANVFQLVDKYLALQILYSNALNPPLWIACALESRLVNPMPLKPDDAYSAFDSYSWICQ